MSVFCFTFSQRVHIDKSHWQNARSCSCLVLFSAQILFCSYEANCILLIVYHLQTSFWPPVICTCMFFLNRNCLSRSYEPPLSHLLQTCMCHNTKQELEFVNVHCNYPTRTTNVHEWTHRLNVHNPLLACTDRTGYMHHDDSFMVGHPTNDKQKTNIKKRTVWILGFITEKSNQKLLILMQLVCCISMCSNPLFQNPAHVYQHWGSAQGNFNL